MPTSRPDAPPAPERSFHTSLRFFALGRVALAALLVLPAILGARAPWAELVVDETLYSRTSLAYLAVALLFLAISGQWRGRFHLQAGIPVLADLFALTVLMHAAGGARSGLGVLMVATVAGAAVLSPPRLSAFFAASATLLLLGESVWPLLRGGLFDPGAFFVAGLVGAACFLTALLVNRLATRLALQEALAQERGHDLRAQLAVTQLVVSELAQGVVVIDHSGRVRTMNPAARALFETEGRGAALQRVLAAVRSRGGARGAGAARSGDPVPAHGGNPAAACGAVELDLEAAPGGTGRHRVRVRAFSPAGGAKGDTVLLIDDLRQLEQRAQQLKLASMGRLSASIAHEIRNPLAAIRHANGLLAEQLGEPRLQRLARIVESNTVRIDRIVEDVLSIARRDRPSAEPIDLARFLETLLPELVVMTGAERRRIEVVLSVCEPISFDPGQLRQVLLNLLGNALRHASAQPGAVRLEWRRGAGDRLELRVADDGPGLPAEMIEHVFEPFFTTESRGTGLGLYLARELCVANGAALLHEPASDGGRHWGAFVIVPSIPGAA